MRRRLVLTCGLVPLLVIAVAILGGRWAGGGVAADPRSPLASALDSLPADTQVAGFTDWARIRQVLGIGAATTASDRAALSDDASLRDLSTRSAIGRFAEEMHDAYGWSPADLDWEAYGQAKDGAGMVARLDGSVSFASVRSHLTKLGYSRAGRVWTIDPDTPAAGAELAAALGVIALLPRQRLIVAADRGAYVLTVLDTIDQRTRSLLSVRSAADIASVLLGADSVLLQTGAVACESTSLAGQGTDVEAQARAAVDRAGDLVEPEFTGRALDAGSTSAQTLRFAMAFGSPSAAAGQRRVRTALASGPFIGRTGRIEDSLVLRSSAVHGSTMLLRFAHDPDSTPYMSGDGPLLFAGCPS